jgi:hypothetical protein
MSLLGNRVYVSLREVSELGVKGASIIQTLPVPHSVPQGSLLTAIQPP